MNIRNIVAVLCSLLVLSLGCDKKVDVLVDDVVDGDSVSQDVDSVDCVDVSEDSTLVCVTEDVVTSLDVTKSVD